MNILSLFTEVFRGYRRSLVVLIVLGFLGAALDGLGINMIVPFIAFLTGAGGSAPTDAITHGTQAVFAFLHIPFRLPFLLVFMTSIFLLRAASLIVFAYVRARISAQFMEQEMSSLFGATLRAKWLFLIQQNGGYLQNTIFWDVKRSANLLDVLAQAVQSWSGCIVYLIVAINISPFITLVTIVAGAVFLFVFRPLVRKTQVLAEISSKTEKLFSQHLIENLSGLKSIKVSGVENAVYKKGYELLKTLQDSYARSILVQSLGTVLIQPFSFIFLLGMFVVSYLMGTFNLGAFAATFYLIQKIFVYLQSGQSSLHSISDLRPYAENITQFKKTLAAERESAKLADSSTIPFSFKNSIEFKDVSLQYGSETTVLSELSFELQKGTSTALIGPSGGGKTSTADLLLRLFSPTSGSILMDGVPIESISVRDWREHIGYVTQDAFLLNATIEDNIRFYRKNLSKEDIIRAAKDANIHDYISELPEGYETIIGDRGVLLSGGQRQRVALARVLAGTPDLLILDEATSALDASSEQLVHEAIKRLQGKITLLIIAHRMQTIEEVDSILVLENGHIAERGSPLELRKNPNSYFTSARKD